MIKEDIVKIINETYRDYDGYVQFSHRPIDKNKDIFVDSKKVEIQNEEGFVYEAHFCNGIESIAIRQLNDSWLISKTNISEAKDIQSYISDIQEFDYKVKMAQIWVSENDPLCENMAVLKLKKVVFAGFEKQEKNNDNSTL